MIGRWLVVVGVIVTAVVVSAQDVTQEMLDALNTARAAVGAPTLVYNTALATAAQQHSNDMAAGGFLSHIGSDGSQFWERMRQNEYPLVTGAENVLYRWDADVQGAYQQWFNSDGHRANMLNPEYTEVGVAYTVAADGRYYFTMVLGAQVGDVVQPSAVVVQPTATMIPPTSLPSPTAIPPVAVAPSATPLAITPLPSVAVPATAPATPTPPTDELENTSPDLLLIWDDRSFALINVAGTLLDIQGVQFESANGVLATTDWETVALSAPLWGFPADGCLQVWGLSYSALADKPDACTFRHAWIALADDRLFWQRVSQFTVTNRGRAVAVCAIPPGMCEVNLQGSATETSPPTVSALPGNASGGSNVDIQLQYDGQSLTVLNVAGRAVNLNGLRLESEQGTLTMGAWENGFLTADLGAFPAGDCVQAWTLSVSDPPIPEGCVIRHAWIALADPRVMWVGVEQFTVYQYDVQLGVCTVAMGRCEIQFAE